MISHFDGDAPSADDFGMGYSSHTADLKIECVRRYFSDPPISIRKLAKEKGVNFCTMAHWIAKAKKAGMLNPGERLPAMVEVAMPPSPIEGPAKPSAAAAPPQAVTISIGKATVTLPASMLTEALEALLRQ